MGSAKLCLQISNAIIYMGRQVHLISVFEDRELGRKGL